LVKSVFAAVGKISFTHSFSHKLLAPNAYHPCQLVFTTISTDAGVSGVAPNQACFGVSTTN
jgi:hypothetical protein